MHTTWAEQTLKRATIQYFYERLGCPPALEWDGAGGVVLQIRDLMVLPVGQKHTKTIRRVLNAIVAGDTYDPAARAPRDVKEHKLSDAEKRIAADCLIDGMGQWQAMHNVNAWRERRGLLPVSRSAVRDGAFSLGLLRFRRGTTDAGNFDKDSPWAIARLAQARQLKAQLEPSLAAYRERRDVARSSKAPVASTLKLEQIAFWDEKHSECKLGYASKHEYVMPNADGSVTRRPRTQPKYDKEARFCLGVSMKQVGNSWVGHRFAPFEYTSLIMVGPKRYQTCVEAEIRAVRKIHGANSEWSKHDVDAADKLDGGRYELRYGSSWRSEMANSLRKVRAGVRSEGIVCVTALMDHIVREGNDFYKSTPFAKSWVLFHDALTQWWEPEAQAHLASLGFPPSRQICAQGETNATNRYKGKLVGNSPELCPLDSNLFSDLEYSMKQHVALTCHLDKDDKKRFKLGTPDEVSKTLRRCWEVAVTSERIVCDIRRWTAAIDAIIKAEGAKVPELDNRRGRRATRALAVHDDAKGALEALHAKWDKY